MDCDSRFRRLEHCFELEFSQEQSVALAPCDRVRSHRTIDRNLGSGYVYILVPDP